MAKTNLEINVKSKEVSKATDRLDDLTSSAKKADKATDGLEKETKQYEKTARASAKATATGTKNLGAMAIKAGLVVGAVALLTKGLKASVVASANLETIETSFVSITGSASEAKDVMEDLASFTASTPFQLEGVAKAARQLITAKGDTEGLTEELQTLGDIAATAAVPIEDLAAIYTKAFNKGKVQAEELNQISERGIPIIKVLADQYGVTKEEVFKLGSEGKIAFSDLQTALRSMSEEGGIAFGAMERQSETLNGKWSTLKDNLNLAAGAMGDFISEGLDLPWIADQATKITAEFKKFIELRRGIDAEREGRRKIQQEYAQSIYGLLDNELELLKDMEKTQKKISESSEDQSFNHKKNLELQQKALEKIQGQLLAYDHYEVALKRAKTLHHDITEEITANSDSYQALLLNTGEVIGHEKERLEALQDQQRNLGFQIAQMERMVSLSSSFSSFMTAIPSYLGGPVAPEPIVQAATDPIEEKSKNGGGGVGGASSRVTEEKEAVEIRLDILKEGWELERALEMAHFDERRKNILDAENITEQERTDLLTRNAEIRAETMKAITVSEHAETLGASANFFDSMAGLAEGYGKRGSAVAKSLAITSATISAYKAFSLALADETVPSTTARYLMAGASLATGLANVTRIASAGNYERGGIVPGTSFSGDNVSAYVNSGEMILNRSQQANLFNQANGRGGGGGNTIINTYTSKPVTVEENNLPNGDRQIIIREAANLAKSELTQEAINGGGTTFPAFQSATGLRRRGTA